MRIHHAISTVLSICLAGSAAYAGSSEWHHVEGASLRVLTSDRPDDDGRVRGALEIRLKPGWKTYWVDPGDAGVPPMLDIAGGTAVEIGFPAPKRFDDGYSVWAGYDHPVALAFTVDPGPAGLGRNMRAEAFLGLCETICVPVQASFTIDVSGTSSDGGDEAAVAQAFARLPGPARHGFGARLAGMDERSLHIEVDVPSGAEVDDLFVASDGRLALGPAEQSAGGTFSIPILYPAEPMPTSLTYTLVTSAGAVSGELPLPR